MRKPAVTGALPHRGTAALVSVVVALAAAASVGGMLSGAGSHSVVLASELGGNAARKTPMTLEALTAELAQMRAETATLRETQNDTSAELSHIRASVAEFEIGLLALRVSTAENEARRLETAAQIASNCSTEGRDASPPQGAGRHRNRIWLAARQRGEQRDRRWLAAGEHRRNPPADRAHRGCRGGDRLDRQEPQASGPQEVGGAALRRAPPLSLRCRHVQRRLSNGMRMSAPEHAPTFRGLRTPCCRSATDWRGSVAGTAAPPCHCPTRSGRSGTRLVSRLVAPAECRRAGPKRRISAQRPREQPV